jgi:Leucine-rich repeat (LRR) protein
MFCALVGITSCEETDEELGAEYGYVQFKLYKNDTAPQKSATRATLDYLSDAHKVKVLMRRGTSSIEQTLVLHSYSAENAAYGLRSDKLQLLAGDYAVVGYTLYDNLDREIGTTNAASQFTIKPNGLVYHNLSVEVTPRGKASFRLVKPESFASTRAGEAGAYPFGDIKAVSFTVRNHDTFETTDINKVTVTFEEGFHDHDIDGSGYNAQTTSFAVDTVVWLKEGRYSVVNYITYADKKASNVLEVVDIKDGPTFEVRDNEFTKDVPFTIQLSETAEHIKDYLALKEIWLALDGPHWSYYGEAEVPGCNWDFNKDLDMWGQQPGVSLGADGRVVALSLAGMGARGFVPDAIGQLTKISVLSLGTHDELLGGHLFDEVEESMSMEKKMAIRMDYHDKFLARDARDRLSDILQEQINRDGKQPAIRPSSRISMKDVQFGKKTNQIKGISRAMMRLTEMQQFYIANSPITADSFFVDVKEDSPFYAEQETWSWTKLEALTDVEIYNCPELTRLPMELFDEDGLPELQSLNIACNSGISAEQLKSDWEAIADGNSGDRLQMLYMGYNNLKEFPTYDKLSKMVKLALLDCTNNQVETLHPFGKNVNLTKVYLDNNKITRIPGHREADGYDYFFGYYDVELFSCTNNLLTEVPDIFNAKSVNIMASVDFSYNQITGFENGDQHHGINAVTVSLSYNRLETMPAVLFKTGSPITTLVLSGNGMKRIPAGSMTGKCSHYLQTLDLSYNKLTDLPSDLWSSNMPYLYGIDLSYNCFSEFPFEPLDGGYLTTFGLRHQRDEQGNRTLRTWPTGLYTCPSLVAFYVGSNDLRKIEDTISPYLRYFEIKDNPNISIDLSDVCDYYRLGYNLLIYDKTQDIRGCDFLLD